MAATVALCGTRRPPPRKSQRTAPWKVDRRKVDGKRVGGKKVDEKKVDREQGNRCVKRDEAWSQWSEDQGFD